MSVLGFLGRRATDDWATDVRPKNWRQGILKFAPNGMTPLTGLLSLAKSERVDDAEFNWWDRELPDQSTGLVGFGIFTTPGTPPTIEFTGEATAGTTVYAGIDDSVASRPLLHFRVGTYVAVVTAASPEILGYAKVTAITSAGTANASLSLLVLITTTNGAFDTGDTIESLGDLNSEGGTIPDALNYDPNKRFNYTQIWRTPLDITRTAKLTRYRTGDAYMDLKLQALELHGMGMEECLMFGGRSENNGTNGHPERTTMGMLQFIQTYGDAIQIADWRDSGNPSTTVFDSALGESWLDDKIEKIFRFANSSSLMAVCGSKAMLGINQLAKASGNFEYHAETAAFGIQVTRLTSAFGELILKTHPLLTQRSHRRDNMFIFNPDNIRFRHITDTMFKGSKELIEAGYGNQDGLKEEYLTEGGYEYHFPKSFMFLSGVGEVVP